MHILFYDPATPITYDWTTLKQQGLGGTEATVLRVAHALKEHHQIAIAQHCRQPKDTLCQNGICYLSLEEAHQTCPDVVVLLRHHRLAEQIGKHFPRAKKFLWLHNMPSTSLYAMKSALLKHQYHIIAVSHFHRQAIERRLRGKWFQQLFSSPNEVPIKVLYNPIDEDLRPDGSAWKANQLLFISSPQKGLAQTLTIFERLQAHFPEYQLLIANPGYQQTAIPLPPQARYLGSLPQKQVIQHLRESFCVFYPQQVRVETFGLVYAEANAVGTPVLAHHAGAASEVLSDPTQLVNGRDFSMVLRKIKEWREQRPILQAKEQFRLSKVKEAWSAMMGE